MDYLQLSLLNPMKKTFCPGYNKFPTKLLKFKVKKIAKKQSLKKCNKHDNISQCWKKKGNNMFLSSLIAHLSVSRLHDLSVYD